MIFYQKFAFLYIWVIIKQEVKYMSIYSMKIKNYKTIKNSEIIFKGNISGIYGPNGTGKTAILEVLEIIKNYYLSFFIDEENMIVNDLKNQILDGISKKENDMEIEIIFNNDEI